MHIVWFKRDLRIYDHEALAQAAKRGPFCLFIFLNQIYGTNLI